MSKSNAEPIAEQQKWHDLPLMDAEPVSILVVDDLPEKLLAYETILEGLGQKVVTAKSGEEALKHILREEFAVILLDVNMPGIDGFETAHLIRNRKKSSHTPIIFLTAFTDEMRMAQGYASGAVDYLPTPVVPEILRAKVRVFIELTQMRKKAASQAEERAMRTVAEKSARRSEFLATASATLAAAKNQTEVLAQMTEVSVPYLADLSLIWLSTSEDKKEKTAGAFLDREGKVVTKFMDNALADCPWLYDAVHKVLDAEHYQLFSKVSVPVIDPANPTLLDLDDNNGHPLRFESVLVIPLSTRTQKGVLVLARVDSVYEYSDTTFANDFSSRISASLDNIMLIERIKESDQRKDEFLAMLAHELRNPLAPISNSLNIMKLTSEARMHKEAEEMIERHVKHMVHLVDDLTDLSRINKGKITLRKEYKTLKDILEHAMETAMPLIKQKSQGITVRLPEEPVWLNVDPVRISQVFSNLLNNASKYTDDKGSIDINVEQANDTVTITISDNGIGIVPEMIPQIFNMFLQVDSSLERAQGGLGIGLTLVKYLVEMHNGLIEAYSDGLKKGSRFVVTFPVSVPPQDSKPEATEMKENKSSPKRVLIVDDNEACAKTTSWMIEILGQEVRIAHNGQSALEIAKTYQPEIVLLDIGLPGMNGYELCKKMHHELPSNKSVYIAQTGWGQAEHLQLSKEAGFDHHLVKPVRIEVLEEILDDIVHS